MGPLLNKSEYFSVLSIWWVSSLKTNSRRLTYIFLSSLCDCPGNHSNCTALPLTHGEMVRLDEGRFPALELNNRRLSVKNSFCRKNGIYTRSVSQAATTAASHPPYYVHLVIALMLRAKGSRLSDTLETLAIQPAARDPDGNHNAALCALPSQRPVSLETGRRASRRHGR